MASHNKEGNNLAGWPRFGSISSNHPAIFLQKLVLPCSAWASPGPDLARASPPDGAWYPFPKGPGKPDAKNPGCRRAHETRRVDLVERLGLMLSRAVVRQHLAPVRPGQSFTLHSSLQKSESQPCAARYIERGGEVGQEGQETNFTFKYPAKPC